MWKCMCNCLLSWAHSLWWSGTPPICTRNSLFWYWNCFLNLFLKYHLRRIFPNEFLYPPLPAYHAGLNSNVRSSVLDDWISSRTQVVVATVAFGYALLTFFLPFFFTFYMCVFGFLSKLFVIYHFTVIYSLLPTNNDSKLLGSFI